MNPEDDYHDADGIPIVPEHARLDIERMEQKIAQLEAELFTMREERDSYRRVGERMAAQAATMRAALEGILPPQYIHGHHQLDRDAWARGHAALATDAGKDMLAVVEAAEALCSDGAMVISPHKFENLTIAVAAYRTTLDGSTDSE